LGSPLLFYVGSGFPVFEGFFLLMQSLSSCVPLNLHPPSFAGDSPLRSNIFFSPGLQISVLATVLRTTLSGSVDIGHPHPFYTIRLEEHAVCFFFLFSSLSKQNALPFPRWSPRDLLRLLYFPQTCSLARICDWTSFCLFECSLVGTALQPKVGLFLSFLPPSGSARLGSLPPEGDLGFFLPPSSVELALFSGDGKPVVVRLVW